MQRWKRRLRDPSGFTLVEVTVAILLLSIGVLATVALADNANRSTTVTKAREGATNVARDVIEGVHAVPWSNLTPSAATGRVQAISGLADADSAKAGWQIVRRNITYTVSLTVCTVDDPSDGFAATHDATFCAIAGSSSKPADSNPSDYRRATVVVTWTDQNGASRTLTQGTTVTNIDNGPAIVSITSNSLSGSSPFSYTGTGLSALDFSVTTDQSANNVDWLINGTKQGAATGSGTSWSFSWPIGAATGGTANGTSGCNPSGTGKVDGTYFVGAQAYSSSSLSAGLQAATVKLNRCSPLAPSNLEAGKSTALTKLEVQWDDNQEQDIVGYRVYRSSSSAGPFVQVPTGGCSGLLTDTDCLDTDPAIVSFVAPYYYRVYAVDRDPSGALREGDQAAVATLPSNRPPSNPAIASGSSYNCYGTPCTLVWGLSTDPDSGDTVDYYNVYRVKSGVPTFASRWDASAFITAQGAGWVDPDASGAPWNYYVTAVDNHGNESGFSNVVVK